MESPQSHNPTNVDPESKIGDNPAVTTNTRPKKYLSRVDAVLTALSFALKVAMFLIGVSTTKDYCPLRPIIPIYLAIAGGVGIFTKLMSIANRNKKIAAVDGAVIVLRIVEFVWMFFGWYWVFSIFQPNFEPYFGVYCDKTMYLFAMSFIILHSVYFIFIIAMKLTKSSLSSW